MPELPEVEVVVRGLQQYVIGKKFVKVNIKRPKMANFTSQKFLKTVQNQPIINVERIGKMIVFKFAHNYLIFHLKMTGQLVYENVFLGGHTISIEDVQSNRFTRIFFTFNDQTHLFFNDQRLFGYCHLIAGNEILFYRQKYGLEPINASFLWRDFWKLVEKHPRLNFKAFLLTQKYVAGIGNIYADEIAFLSKIKPIHSLQEISKKKWQKVHKNIKKILLKSIEYNGTTFSSFLTADGEKGNFMQFLKVYGRGGLPCLSCAEDLIKIKLAGRGTVYCENCQK